MTKRKERIKLNISFLPCNKLKIPHHLNVLYIMITFVSQALQYMKLEHLLMVNGKCVFISFVNKDTYLLLLLMMLTVQLYWHQW